jgi:hypothetical protein
LACGLHEVGGVTVGDFVDALFCCHDLLLI